MTKLEEVRRAIADEDCDPLRRAYCGDGKDKTFPCTCLKQAAAAVKMLSNPAAWPMDEIATALDRAGIDQPRPRDVLRAFFDAILPEAKEPHP